jgi:hypothetical protein
MSQATTNAARKYEQFLEMVESKILEANSQGKALPATKLAKDIGPAFGWEWPQAYHFISAYIDERPDLHVKKGPKGGIEPKPATIVAPVDGSNE